MRVVIRMLTSLYSAIPIINPEYHRHCDSDLLKESGKAGLFHFSGTGPNNPQTKSKLVKIDLSYTTANNVYIQQL